jgi:hypothetical protein
LRRHSSKACSSLSFCHQLHNPFDVVCDK